MSRYSDRRQRPTLRDFNESRAAWETYEANVIEADFQRNEREEDEAEARADARERSGWTPLGDAA
jgi:hypothetical protein